MGVTLPKNTRIAGFTMGAVKNALKSYARTGSARNFFYSTTIAPSKLQAAILYEELLERGLIVPDAERRERLTDSGEAIAKGKTSRSSSAAANMVLDELLDRVTEMNAQGRQLKFVDRIWLFGSHMRGEETVGDIDLAIETARNPAVERSALSEELIGIAPSHMDRYQRLDWHLNQGIFGKRRHPLLAGAIMGTDDLEGLAVPCRLIYDRGRGGRVHDEILPRHPKSTGRSADMPAPLVLPDLGPISSPARPMDLRWMGGYCPSGAVPLHGILDDETDLGFRFCSVVTPETSSIASWDPRSVIDQELDGVDRAILKYHDEYRDPAGKNAGAIVIHRQISETDDGIEIDVEFSDLVRPAGLEDGGNIPFVHLGKCAAAAMVGDILRQATRVEENGREVGVFLNIDATRIPDEARDVFEHAVEVALDTWDLPYCLSGLSFVEAGIDFGLEDGPIGP